MFTDLAVIQGLIAAGPAMADKLEAYGDLDTFPRPWDPGTLSPALRRWLWEWLDEVAAWLNRDYAWDPDQALPACWPRHPQIVHELAVVASLRHLASTQLGPAALEDWHRYTLPMFRSRALPSIHCKPGDHAPWPGQTRHDRFLGDDARQDRITAFTRDLGQPPDTLDPGPEPGPDSPGITPPPGPHRGPGLHVIH